MLSQLRPVKLIEILRENIDSNRNYGFKFQLREYESSPFKRQPHKMVKHTQTNRLSEYVLPFCEYVLPFYVLPFCLSMFYHFVGLELKGLKVICY